MQKTINCALFKKMFQSGVKLLDANRAYIDSLNVFPVPDGDTGTNMSLTLQSSLKELQNLSGNNNMSDAAEAVAKGALRGARGNSGVITSQILRGFCSVIKENENIDTKTFAKALKSGTEIAYNAVSKPKEGTMLTVIRVIAENALQICKKESDMDSFLTQVLIAGENILQQTPEMLPVLKKAGVVDAGGRGIIILLTGMHKGFRGEEIDGSDINIESQPLATAMQHADISSLDDIEFAYCTEFFIVNINKKTTQVDIDKFRDALMAIGDSVLVIGDLEFIKVHVHTNKPGVALNYAIELGELDKLKIENMLEQNRQLLAQYEAERKEQGMLAVCAGNGLKQIFKDLLIDAVIEGGQTMNPSANDIAEASKKVNSEHIYIFPNNKNIILAAEQAKALVENKTLHVIPTKNIPQGLSAALAFNPDASVEENIANMSSALDCVSSGQVTYAVRSTKVDGFDLEQGDIIGLDNKTILAKGDNIGDVTKNLIVNMKNASHTMITLYYGNDITEEQAIALKQEIAEQHPDCEVEVYAGGQPIYYYILSLE